MIPISLGLHPLPNGDAWLKQNPKLGGFKAPCGTQLLDAQPQTKLEESPETAP